MENSKAHPNNTYPSMLIKSIFSNISKYKKENKQNQYRCHTSGCVMLGYSNVWLVVPQLKIMKKQIVKKKIPQNNQQHTSYDNFISYNSIDTP